MTNVADSVSLAQIHAYVDNQLDSSECEIVEEYFDTNPEKFAELQQYLAINDNCHAMYDSILVEPIPEYMLNRMYDDAGGPFGQQKRRDSIFVKNSLSRLLFRRGVGSDMELNKQSLRKKISNQLYVFFRLERLEDKPWFQNLRQKFPHDSNSEQKSQSRAVLTRIIKQIRLHPLTAPLWLRKLISVVSEFFGKIYSFSRTMNIYSTGGVIALGIVIGWNINTAQQSKSSALDPSALIDIQAVKAHEFFADEGRPLLNTDSDDKAQLLYWISNLLQQDIQIVDFTEMGFANIGLSAMPTASSYAFVTTYENDKFEKLTLYVGAASFSHDSEKSAQQLVCSQADSLISLCSWTKKKLRFVVVSDLRVSETKQISEWIIQNQSMAHMISWKKNLTFNTYKA